MTPAASSAVKHPLRDDHLGASTFIEKGWNLIAVGDFLGAESALLHAIELAPTNPRARSMLGWALMRQGFYDKAEELFNRLLSENSHHAMARVNLGYVCFRKGDLDRATELLESSSLQIRDPKAVLYGSFYLGLLFAGTGRLSEAEACYRRSIMLAPNFAEAQYELGRAQLAGGRVEEARATWLAGHSANRFNIWGRRCAVATRLVEQGLMPGSFS